jgi:imidazolonepropionase-like amidohydrolase
MVKQAVLLCAALAAGCGELADAPQRPQILRGFVVVDPTTQSAQTRDIYVAQGKVSALPASGAADVEVVEGHGRWLLPGFYDLRVAAWGNASALHYEKLYQDMGLDSMLKAQLYSGVTSVGIGMGAGRHFQDEIQRIELMEIITARAIRAARPLCGPMADAPADTISSVAEVAPHGDLELKRGSAYFQVYYSQALKPLTPPVSRDIMLACLAQATKAGKPAWVIVGSWAEAKEAVNAGAKVIQGLPSGAPDASLLKHMAKAGVYFAPNLSWLETEALPGPDSVLLEPLASDLARLDILESYRHPEKFEESAKFLRDLPSLKLQAFQGLQQAQRAGVKLLLATGAGWEPAAFQGLASHRILHFMAQAKIPAWIRLRAATQWPAEFLNQRSGFSPGDPADFLVLGNNPLLESYDHPDIQAVCLGGAWVDRAKIKPDLWRQHYPPRPQ